MEASQKRSKKNSQLLKKTGAVFTPSRMANYLAKELLELKKPDNLSEVCILDPACGDGALLIALAEQLLAHRHISKINIVGYEINEQSARRAERGLTDISEKLSVRIYRENFFDIDQKKCELFDYVIANPPYIRTQVLGAEQSQVLAKKNHINGRIDAYYIFLLGAGRFLRPDGISGYITSNKFLTIKSGAPIRNSMLKKYSIHKIIDFGDTKPFPGASVLPCIVIFSKGSTSINDTVPFVSAYEKKNKFDTQNHKDDIFDYIDGQHDTDDCPYIVNTGYLNHPKDDDLWVASSNEREDWLERVEKKIRLHFSDIGKIKVGIKTTADSVFIGDSLDTRIELLKPLITHRDAGQIKSFKNNEWKVLYTHTLENGKKTPYKIEDYPYAYNYLCQHKQRLEKRTYIKKANRKWFEIWVPQDPAAWSDRKIIFRDICEHPQFWLDTSGAIVNGDCYWIDIYNNVDEDIIMLALAIANSHFIERYYDAKFNTKLYSGKRRYITQYVNQFPIPNPSLDISQQLIRLTKDALDCKDEAAFSIKLQRINALVDQLFA